MFVEAIMDHSEDVQTLDEGADRRTRKSRADAAFYHAAQCGLVNVVKLLLGLPNTNVNVPSGGLAETAIGDLEMLQDLL